MLVPRRVGVVDELRAGRVLDLPGGRDVRDRRIDLHRRAGHADPERARRGPRMRRSAERCRAQQCGDYDCREGARAEKPNGTGQQATHVVVLAAADHEVDREAAAPERAGPWRLADDTAVQRSSGARPAHRADGAVLRSDLRAGSAERQADHARHATAGRSRRRWRRWRRRWWRWRRRRWRRWRRRRRRRRRWRWRRWRRRRLSDRHDRLSVDHRAAALVREVEEEGLVGLAAAVVVDRHVDVLEALVRREGQRPGRGDVVVPVDGPSRRRSRSRP